MKAIFATVFGLVAGSALAVDFSHEVVPILRAKCGKCHTGSQRQGGFSLNDREALLAGGDSGTPGLVAGDRWCLCAARWLEAAESGRAPPVVLEATHEKTLATVPLDLLKQHAVTPA